MRLRSVLPLGLLLATPLLAAGAPAAPILRAGSLEINVDPAAVSLLPIESAALRSLLCTGFPPDDWGAISPRGECDISVSPPPKMLVYVDDATSVGGPARVSLQPLRWEPWQGSAPVDSACGRWDVAVELDPTRAQPVSQLALEPSVGDSAQGVFAGALKLAALYRFVNRDKATWRELPATLSLELSGHWAMADAKAPRLAEGATNLVLFAGVFGGQWFAAPSCVPWGGVRCKACLEPAPEVLESLSAGPP